MKEYILPPYAASLSQSLRDLGYSIETAIADLIDNSITAAATRIDIYFDTSTALEPFVAVVDNGVGMSAETLLEAMRPGSANPQTRRSVNDLGRFGLGLKTASFSQCKSLTVVSRNRGVLVGATWDLDVIAERNSWIVTLLDEQDVQHLPGVAYLGSEGTCVIWRKLDRLMEMSHPLNSDEWYAKANLVEQHIALVFHRYMSGEYGEPALTIYINGHRIEPFDPFCRENNATQVLQQEVIQIDGQNITIQPYILPHHSKLSQKKYDHYRLRSDFVNNQGAYIYRSGRLMTWGDWFRLQPKSEDTKLVRVQIDFPNALDSHWTIDIKKSRAYPPAVVRERLKRLLPVITRPSQRIHKGRATKLLSTRAWPVWERQAVGSAVQYRISREHPLVKGLQHLTGAEHGEALEHVLAALEGSVPVEAIYADYASLPRAFDEPSDIAEDTLRTQIRQLYTLTRAVEAVSTVEFMDMLSNIKPFSQHRELVQKLIKEIGDEQ